MSKPKNDKSDLPFFEDIDRVIHEPARLAIMIHLSVVKSADFLYLKRQTKLTWGNLSSHITKLEFEGYIQIEKKFIDRKPHTVVHLTDKGRAAFRTYKEKMKQLFED